MRLWRKCFFFILMILMSSRLSALTLGNFEVQTRALENFRGEIELYNVYETDYRNIDVTLIAFGSESKERLDDGFWKNLGVGVSLSNGLAWVSVYSTKPLRVSVDVRVQVSWPEGQVERIYTISPIGVEKPLEKASCGASETFVYCR